MFKFLTSKKGYTLVELMIVLVLLSLGAYALINLFSVAYRSFDKSEERYIKQEAVKEVAALLQSGANNSETGVASAKTADIFNTVDVVPAGAQTDDSFSYLFATQSYDDEGNPNGYFLYIQDKGETRASAVKLSETPIYVEIKPYFETKTRLDAHENEIIYAEQYNKVTITLSALEDDYDYSSGNPPTSDDKYYSIDVAYHFPNMATSSEYCMVNHKTRSEYSTAPLYSQVANDVEGGKTGSEVTAIHCDEKCSYSHCGCNDLDVECNVCNCDCPGKRGIVLRVYCDSIIGVDNKEAAVSVPSMCFIATASYGLDSGEVGALCAFRDNVLMKFELGRDFVDTYYKYSPPIADFIRENEALKSVVRTGLKPVVMIAEYAMNEEIRAEGIVSFLVLMACGASGSAVLVRLDKNRKKARRKAKNI